MAYNIPEAITNKYNIFPRSAKMAEREIINSLWVFRCYQKITDIRIFLSVDYCFRDTAN